MLRNTHSTLYTKYKGPIIYNTIYNTKTDKSLNRKEKKIEEGANRQHDKLITNMETSISWVSINEKNIFIVFTQYRGRIA